MFIYVLYKIIFSNKLDFFWTKTLFLDHSKFYFRVGLIKFDTIHFCEFLI
jgi:hypothetical protein